MPMRSLTADANALLGDCEPTSRRFHQVLKFVRGAPCARCANTANRDD